MNDDRAPHYTLLSSDGLRTIRAKYVRQVCDVIDISSEEAEQLQTKSHWHTNEAIIASALATGATDAGPSSSHPSSDATQRSSWRPTTGDFFCVSCLCTKRASSTAAEAQGSDTRQQGGYVTDCNVTMCKDCWLSYVGVVLGDESRRLIPCPGPGCLEPLPDFVVHDYYSDISHTPEEAAERLEEYRTERLSDFVEHCEEVTQCPVAACGALYHLWGESTHVICEECGEEFCSSCRNEAHSPVSCYVARSVIRLSACEDQAETVTWLVAHTAPCPHCGVRIENSGTCNAMKCTVCNESFIWPTHQAIEAPGADSLDLQPMPRPSPDVLSLISFYRYHQIEVELIKACMRKSRPTLWQTRQPYFSELMRAHRELKWLKIGMLTMNNVPSQAAVNSLATDLTKYEDSVEALYVALQDHLFRYDRRPDIELIEMKQSRQLARQCADLCPGLGI